MNSPLKIRPVKGCPMLHGVGKKSPERVRHFPAQIRINASPRRCHGSGKNRGYAWRGSYNGGVIA